ncbi:DUF4393 domain-containing protein [Enterococcus thailandicus]|uniref:DUF4393 domain-containing protein n=1 Tax=Enterococcus thailandicus TaxID=417368 RepID=UPI0025434327|nr:DUF4393 domain-containing protein [Enterococcus thailandicus]MDK4351665.1 DUF4393 domain-containing protein [Enterococcus thailandicus]
MDPIITNALMTFGAGFTGATFAKAKGPGQALDDIMALVGFEKLHEVAEKKRAKRDAVVQKYKESIAQNIVAIPDENIQEPTLAIVGPALEASKFYIEEDSLREMFAKVIGLSMDSSFNDKIHPSFVEIIKQLSPYDAQVLCKIKEVNLFVGSPYPVMQMVLKSDQGTKTIFPLIALFKNDVSFDKNAVSINNLDRLGILRVDMGRWPANDSLYAPYYENYVVNSVLEKQPTFELEKGSFSLSDFGKNFIDLCVE